MGYGARAIEALNSFYSGEMTNLDDLPQFPTDSLIPTIPSNSTLQTDSITVKDVSKMPPLLQRLSERKPEQLDYLGVSYGLTKDLLRFWKRAGFVPLYASQKENALTGEYTFVMLRSLLSNVAQADGWLSAFSQGSSLLYKINNGILMKLSDFRHRFMNLLSYESFKKFESSTALSIIEATSPKNSSYTSSSSSKQITADELHNLLTPFDMKRLESYSENMLDYHVILDLIPSLAGLVFSKKLGDECNLSAAQQAILLALGLQRKTVEDLEVSLALPWSRTSCKGTKADRQL